MAERTYRIIADEAQVDAAGVLPRPPSLRAAKCVFWDIPDAELADIPVLRQWFREHGIEAYERGESKRSEAPPSGTEPYLIVSASWVPWKGPELTRLDPCEGCGLDISTVSPAEVSAGHLDDVLDKLAEAPMFSLPATDCYVAHPELVAAVRSAGLGDGLVTHPLDSRGRALLIWSEHSLGGPAYPYGPPPCTVCGRATREVDGEEELALPNHAYGLTFEAQLAHWSWSTFYGQQTPLISQLTAEFLLDVIPTMTFIPHGRPDDPGAFLPEPYRQ